MLKPLTKYWHALLFRPSHNAVHQPSSLDYTPPSLPPSPPPTDHRSDLFIQTELIAYLAEFNVLRAEIMVRSDFQHRTLQFHLTLVAFIIGFSISQHLAFLILLIPIESLTFGI